MISGFNRVTRKGQDVAQPQGMGSHQVGLQGNAVAIAAGHLTNGLYPLPLQ